MANHPYNQHREQQVAHRRVSTILSGSPAGAEKHAKGSAFSKITSKSAASRDDDVRGHSSPKRFARGGHVKGKGKSGTNIAIVLPGGGKGAVPAGPMGAGPPPGGPPPMPPHPMGGPPPGLPPGMPPGMPPGGLPPGGPPPGMPMRASGGRIKGEATKANNAKWSKRAKANSYFRGGAATGVGREEKAEKQEDK